MSTKTGYNWRGKPLEDMTREELIDALVILFERSIQDRKEQAERLRRIW